MGTHQRVLIESYRMCTNMAGSRWFSNLCVLLQKVALALASNSQIMSLLITNAYIAFHISDINVLIVYELCFLTVTITRQIIETNSRTQLDFSASTAQASPLSYHLAATNHQELAGNCKYTEMSIVSNCKSVQCFNIFQMQWKAFLRRQLLNIHAIINYQ